MSPSIFFSARKLSFYKVVPLVASSLTFGVSCTFQPDAEDEFSSARKSQQELLAELDANRARWANLGDQAYAFSVDPECSDCPSEVSLAAGISVERDGRRRESSDVGRLNFSTSDNRVRTSDADDNGRRIANNGGLNLIRNDNDGASVRTMENYFANVRQGIVTNQIQNVVYNPTYGYPQQVRVNGNNDDNASRNFRTTDFRFTQPTALPAQVSMVGAVSYNSNNGFAVGDNNVWLSEDNGKLNQLRLSQQALNRLSAIPSGTRVQALGRWGVSNINGQMVLDADDLSPYQTSVASTFINGRLNVGYSQIPTYSGNQSSVYSYSVVDDDGRVTQLSIPDNLSSQVLPMSGSRVRLLGSYIPTSYGGTTTFAVSQSLSVPEVPVQLNGTLANAGTNTPGIYGQTQSWLIDDSGKWNELRVPVGLSSLFNSIAPNARVTVSGVYVNNATGSPAIELRDIREIRNFLTEITLTGTVSSLYGQVAYPGSHGTVGNLALTTDNGERYELRAGANLPNLASLVPGTRVQVVGTWSPTGSSGLGVIDARYVQPLATAFSTTTLDGTILGRDYSVFNSDAYLLQVSDGRVLRMTVPYGTAGIQQGVTLNNGSQIRVTGNLRTDVNEIEAREIISNMPTALPTTVTGTMLNWGYVGSMAQSLVLMESTGRVWQVGFLQPGTQINPQNTGLSPGMQLRVSGNARSDGTLDANLIEIVSSPVPTYLPTPQVAPRPTPPQPPFLPVPVQQVSTSISGTVSAILTFGNVTQRIEVLADNGQRWQVTYTSPGQTIILPQQLMGSMMIEGMRLRITGTSPGFPDPTLGYTNTLNADVIEVISQSSPYPTIGSGGGLFTGGFNVFDATISGWNAISDPYSFTAGPTYLYTATDDSGRALQLRVSGQVLSLATNTASLRVGGRVRVTGVNSGDGSNQIQVQRIEGVY